MRNILLIGLAAAVLLAGSSCKRKSGENRAVIFSMWMNPEVTACESLSLGVTIKNPQSTEAKPLPDFPAVDEALCKITLKSPDGAVTVIRNYCRAGGGIPPGCLPFTNPQAERAEKEKQAAAAPSSPPPPAPPPAAPPGPTPPGP